jgi:uncharacterized protein DUF4153
MLPPEAEMAEAVAGDRAEAAEAGRPRIGTRAAIAILGAGLFASVVVPGSRAGLGLALASQAVLIAATLDSSVRRAPWRMALLIAAALLAITPLVRDADWLVTLDLLVALGLAVIALVGPTTLAGYASAALTFTLTLVLGPLEVLRPTVARAPAITPEALVSVTRAGLITAALLAVFIGLFASADGAFAQLSQDLSPDLHGFDLPIRIGVALIALAIGGSLALLVGSSDERRPGSEAKRLLGPIEWGAALGALIILFAGFVTVQFVVLFGGQDHVLETAGLTYAEYARQGFTQLVIAAVLILAVIAAALRLSRIESDRQRLIMHLLLATLATLTLVILASAAHRLDLYVEAFGATRLRVLAIAGCALIAGTLILTIAALFTRRRTWLPQGIAGIFAVIALGLTAANPDSQIAERNVDRYQQSGRFDISYNGSLSADATPVLTELPTSLAARTLQRQTTRLALADGFWGSNLGRSRARDALESRAETLGSP